MSDMTPPRPKLKSRKFKPGCNPNSLANLRMHRKGALQPWWTQPSVPPRKFVDARYLPLITQLAAKGCRASDIARAVGMNERTWVKCLDEQPGVREAFDAGRQQMHDSLVGKLYQRAMHGDTACLIFAHKVLLGYRENEPIADQRPVVNITLPGPAASLEDFKRMVTVEQPEPALLTHDGNGDD